MIFHYTHVHSRKTIFMSLAPYNHRVDDPERLRGMKLLDMNEFVTSVFTRPACDQSDEVHTTGILIEINAHLVYPRPQKQAPRTGDHVLALSIIDVEVDLIIVGQTDKQCDLPRRGCHDRFDKGSMRSTRRSLNHSSTVIITD